MCPECVLIVQCVVIGLKWNQGHMLQNVLHSAMFQPHVRLKTGIANAFPLKNREFS